MEELFKKVVYSGVGIAAFTTEKVKEVIDKLIAENKITQEEGKKIVDDMMSTVDVKRAEFEDQVKGIVDKVTGIVKFDSTKDEPEEAEVVEVTEKTAKATMKKTAEEPSATAE